MGREVGKWPGRIKKILTFVLYSTYQRGYVNTIILLRVYCFVLFFK